MHSIPGKDAPLETSIQAMLNQLAKHGFVVQEQAWQHPLEHVWSVHLQNSACPAMFTNGKGASRQAALASALGEFLERLSTGYFWNHAYFGPEANAWAFVHHPQERWFPFDSTDPDAPWPKGLLNAALQRFYNPSQSVPTEALVDMNSGSLARGICAIPYTRLSDDKTVYFPVNLMSNLYVSNGMAAGNTLEEARTQALSEILERHVKYSVVSENLCLPDVPQWRLENFPSIAADIAALRQAGFKILIKDASLGGQFPVLCVALLHPVDQGLFVSFGAHPRFEIALERALTELLQGRGLEDMTGFPPPGLDEEELASAPNLEIHFVDSSGVVGWRFLAQTPDFNFVDWYFSQSTQEDYQWLCGAIHAQGYEIYVADFTRFGVYACRILVPGLSEIYPIDDLEWENNSVANQLRPFILRLPNLDEEARQDLLTLLLELNLADERPVCALIGIEPPADTAWAHLRIGELKALLALSCQDAEVALEGCQWAASFIDLAPERRAIYHCAHLLLALDPAADYQDALAHYFSGETLETATRLVQGEARFFDLPFLGEQLENCPAHQQLLAEYKKALAAMQAA